jgi:hypothetical protein
VSILTHKEIMSHKYNYFFTEPSNIGIISHIRFQLSNIRPSMNMGLLNYIQCIALLKPILHANLFLPNTALSYNTPMLTTTVT